MNFDMSVFKNARILERATVQFQVESFNVFNHKNLNNAVDSKNINRSFGILSTPVIDPETGVMYVVDWDTNDTAHQNRSLHVNALRLKDGGYQDRPARSAARVRSRIGDPVN